MCAGLPQVPVITISDLRSYVSQRLRELTNRRHNPIMVMPKCLEDFPISRRLQ
jgi:hypothetical protein